MLKSVVFSSFDAAWKFRIFVFQRRPAPRWYLSLDPLIKYELIRNVQAKTALQFIEYCTMEFQFAPERVNQFLCWWNLEKDNSNAVTLN